MLAESEIIGWVLLGLITIIAVWRIGWRLRWIYWAIRRVFQKTPRADANQPEKE